MKNAGAEELEGTTLSVYLYTVKKGKPVGPRDVMKGVRLSSPSVAYRHLQKLEDMGYLQKNQYGEYIIKSKAPVKGYLWLGRHIMPKMLFYAVVFMCILITEIIVLALHYPVENYVFKIFFLLLILVTGSAMCVFTAEWLMQRKQIKRSIQPE
ncbi:MAG: hypothetical protein ACPLKZ_01200 [Candidatus Bathyarchaeales archaeon]